MAPQSTSAFKGICDLPQNQYEKARAHRAVAVFRFAVAMLAIVVIPSLPTALQAKDRPEREWFDISGTSRPEKFCARLIDGSVGTVRLRRSADGSESSIKLENLDENDRTYVKSELGLDVIDLTGVWRTKSGTYYSIVEGPEGKVYVQMLDSPILSSVEAVMIRKNGKVVAQQWLSVFKEDPSHKPRKISAVWSLPFSEQSTAKVDRISISMDVVYWDEQGKELKHKRKKETSSFVRLHYEEIPDRVREIYFPTPKTREEKLAVVIQRLVFCWVAREGGKRYFPRDGITDKLARVAISQLSDNSLKAALRDYFFDRSLEEVDRFFEFCVLVLDNPTAKELAEDAETEWILDQIKTHSPELEKYEPFVDFVRKLKESSVRKCREEWRMDRGSLEITMPGLAWQNDDYVCHEARCPVCGKGTNYGSGHYGVELRVYFSGGTPESIQRPIWNMRIKCSDPCTVGTGQASGLYLILYGKVENWTVSQIRSYLAGIGSPFADSV